MQLAGATATAGTSPEHLREWAILMAALPSSTNPAQLKQWAQVLGHLPAGTKPEAVLKALAIAQALPAGAQPEQAKEWEGLLTALPADTKAHHLAALPRDFAQLAQRLPKVCEGRGGCMLGGTHLKPQAAEPGNSNQTDIFV
jgi:hypothetical protein